MNRIDAYTAGRVRQARVVFTALMLAALGSNPLIARQEQDSTLPCVELGRLLVGTATPIDDSCIVALPRSDVSLTLLGATLPPGIALESYAVFQAHRGEARVLGELAVTTAEVQGALRSLRTAAFVVDAVHAHMAGESPPMTYIHFRGTGDVRELASLLRQAIGQPVPASPFRDPAIVGEYGVVAGLPCPRLAVAMGADPEGMQAGPGYCRLLLPGRLEPPSLDGALLPAPIVRTGVAFRQMPQRTSAVMIARLVLRETAIVNALDRLIEAGVEVVALHDDLIGELPRLAVLHVQARGNPLLLAEALKETLDAAAQDGSSRSSGGPLSRIR